MPRTHENGARTASVSRWTTWLTRVHAGVGAAGADGAHRGARTVGEAGQRLFEPVLHRHAAGLALPAVVGAAAVADAERDPHAAAPLAGGTARGGRRAVQVSASSMRCARAFCAPEARATTSSSSSRAPSASPIWRNSSASSILRS